MLSFLPHDATIRALFADHLPDERRRARLVNAFGMLGLTGGVGLAVLHYFFFDTPLALALPALVVGIASALVPPALLRLRSIEAGGHFIALCWWSCTVWGVYFRGGLAAPPIL